MTGITAGAQPPRERKIYLVASGDSRHPANVAGWPAQLELESSIIRVASEFGIEVARAHEFKPDVAHGFISSQREGMDVLVALDPDSAVIVAESVWQFSHHVLAGLLHHRGPIITIANWSGQWPGLVGLLNLNASLAKAGRSYSTLWSESFDDAFFRDGFRSWLDDEVVEHDYAHVIDFDPGTSNSPAIAIGTELAAKLRHRKAIIGVIDEGCMGMFNAIIDDFLLHPTGIFKERLSQTALLAEMALVTDKEASDTREWLSTRGFTFNVGTDEATELTDKQIHSQMKMYIAAGRMADRFDCDAIGIQYQLGMADMAPASDLAEGLLNNTDRPPITRHGSDEVIRDGEPIPHFNEVDEGVAVDLVVTNRVWKHLGIDPSATLHDVRWGENFDLPGGREFVWTLMISGSIPANHIDGGYAAAHSDRQPAMYFQRGGGTLSGVSRPGAVVWSRVYQIKDQLHADVGTADAVELPAEETARRLAATTPEWPIMHAVLHGVTRNQFMAQHKSNHVTVAYAESSAQATEAMLTKAAMFSGMGLQVHICGASVRTDA